MKTIQIIDNIGFTACQAAGKSALNEKYRGITVRPNGTVVGVHGHYAVICENCVEPFDGDTMIQLRIDQLTKAQAHRKGDLAVNIDGGSVTLTNSRQEVLRRGIVVPLTVFDETWFTYRHNGNPTNSSAFNAEYLFNIAKVMNKHRIVTYIEASDDDAKPHNVWFNEAHTGARMILMPIKQ